MNSDTVTRTNPPRLPGEPANPGPAAISTQALFGSAKEVLIRHGKSVYRLRITSKDKLILTK